MEPYRIFFRLGGMFGFLFILVWSWYVAVAPESYPVFFHAHGIVSLFLGSFIVGFLLTAIPRFTGSPPAARVWIRVQLVLALAEISCLIAGQYGFAALLSTVKIFVLIAFVARCVRNAKLPAPPTFVWVGFGLMAGIVGTLGTALNEWGWLAPEFLPLGKNLFQRGFPVALFMGVGGRLVPLLSGVQDCSRVQIQSPAGSPAGRILPHFVLAVLYFSGLTVEALLAGSWERRGLVAQAAAVGGELALFWDLWKFPMRHARGIGLWSSSWALFVGHALAAMNPSYKVHLLHIAYVVGLFGGTLVVASHVIVMHESRSPVLLSAFRPLGIIWILALLAGLTRASAPWLSYANHLAYASVAATGALFLWAWSYLRARPRASEPSRC